MRELRDPFPLARWQCNSLERRERARSVREQHNRESNRLAKLPSGIRSYIYDLVVPSGMTYKCSKPNREVAVGILKACRSLHNDITPIFFGNNTFLLEFREANEYKSAWTWLNCFSPLAIASTCCVRFDAIVTYKVSRFEKLNDRSILTVAFIQDIGTSPFSCAVEAHIPWRNQLGEAGKCPYCRPPIPAHRHMMALLASLDIRATARKLDKETLTWLLFGMRESKQFEERWRLLMQHISIQKGVLK